MDSNLHIKTSKELNKEFISRSFLSKNVSEKKSKQRFTVDDIQMKVVRKFEMLRNVIGNPLIYAGKNIFRNNREFGCFLD